MIDNNEISDDFEKLLEDFITNSDINLDESDNTATEETHEELPFGDYRDSKPSTNTTQKASQNKSQVAWRPNFARLCVNDCSSDDFGKPFFIESSIDTVKLDLESVDYHDGHDELAEDAALMHVYKKGSSKPLVSSSIAFGAYLAVSEADLSGCRRVLGPGRYELVVTGVDLSDVSSFRQRGDAFVAIFTVADSAPTGIALIGASLKASLVAADALDIHLKTTVKRSQLTCFRFECYEADTLSFMCNASSSKTRTTLFNRINWICGNRYAIMVFANRDFIGRVDFTFSRKKIAPTVISSSDADIDTLRLAAICSPYQRDIETWRRVSCTLGATALKREYVRYAFVENLNRARISSNLPSSIRLASNYIVYGVDTAGTRELLKEIAVRGNEDIYDFEIYNGNAMLEAKEAADARMVAPGDDMQEFNLSSHPGLIINPSALASERMFEHMAKLCSELESTASKGCSIIGARSDIGRLEAAYPWLADHFPTTRRFEITRPAPYEFVSAVLKALMHRHMMSLTDKQIELIATAVNSCTNMGVWTLEMVNSFVDRHIIANYAQRLLSIAPQANWSCTQLSTIEDCDIDLSMFAENNADNEYERSVAELNQMIGLDDIKSQLDSIFSRAKFCAMRRQAGLPSSANATYHAIFTGNPGTGKTTVAKLMGKIFHALGIISKGDVVVLDRKALVGQYLGDTERNTRTALEQAKGNVLFIDEAYALTTDRDDKRDYGRRVIDSLMTVLSAPCPDTVVILAGYEREMEDMLRVNTGLASRFPLRLSFPDYTASELLAIAKSLIAKEGYVLSPDAEAKLSAVIADAVAGKKREFGNGRWVEQLVHHRILEAMARRVIAQGGDLSTILPCDIEPLPTPAATSIGFRCA